MKMIAIVLFSLLSLPLWAQTYVLDKGEATYTVKHLIKMIKGTSKELKGKIACKSENCEFLLAIKVTSFISSDSNRDLNMRETVDADKYPVTTAQGHFKKEDWNKSSFILSAEVEFHGVKKTYPVTVEKIGELHQRGKLILKLDQHQIERPSLFTAKIDDDVPLEFDLHWKQ